MRELIFTIICTLAIAGCTKNPIAPVDPEKHADHDANKWIYSVMSKEYLYNDIYKNITPNYDRSCEYFFKSLLSKSSLHNDGKHPNRFGNDYFYSYMTRTSQSKSLTGLSYGFDFILYSLNDGSYFARVLYIVSGSVADKAGLNRGDWITKINNNKITEDNYIYLKVGGKTKLEVRISDKTSTDPDKLKLTPEIYTITLEQASNIEDNPIHHASVLSLGAKRVGYLMYNSFSSHKDDGTYLEHGKYNNQLREIFSQFKSAGVTDMVLDLRYNQGGYISCANLLASLIVKDVHLGDIFATLKYASKTNSSQQIRLHNKGEVPQNINMSKLYVLTTQNSASSSEMVINGLRPYIDVIIVGDITEGKNVGSYTITSPTHELSLQPITTLAYNKLDESDYKNGFRPDITALDYGNLSYLYDFGQSDEYLLNIALRMIAGQSVKSNAQTKGSGVIRSYKLHSIDRLKGSIITY